ncbi:MAG TPA: single-stranded DNA-binding protein, partial [Candidatus Limnocylindria bacterium]|nr:single-stranded DNA-binding protein [Candidatus Limnocylindria bacterium]
NRQFKNRQTGAMVQEVCYVDIDVWGAQAESCKQYLQKGCPVLIEGRLKFDTWEDPNGQTRNKHTIVADRVVFLSSGAGAEVEEEIPQDPKAKELFDQIDQIKQRQATSRAAGAVRAQEPAKDAAPKKAKKAAEPASQEGEITFKDEQPFLEDLPF